MPRTGTGPFPAPRSSFPVPGWPVRLHGPGHPVQRGPLRRVLRLRREQPVRPRRPGSHAQSGARPGRCRPDYAARTTPPGRRGSAGHRPGGLPRMARPGRPARTIPTVPRSGPSRPGWIWVRCPAPCRAPACTPGWCSPSGGRPRLADSVELIVSELMTNALRACTDPVAGRPGYDAEGRQLPLGLRLASDRRQVLVEIWDGDHGPAGARPDQPRRRDRARPFNGGGGQQPLGLLLPGPPAARHRAGRAGRQGRLGPRPAGRPG